MMATSHEKQGTLLDSRYKNAAGDYCAGGPLVRGLGGPVFSGVS